MRQTQKLGPNRGAQHKRAGAKGKAERKKRADARAALKVKEQG